MEYTTSWCRRESISGKSNESWAELVAGLVVEIITSFLQRDSSPVPGLMVCDGGNQLTQRNFWTQYVDNINRVEASKIRKQGRSLENTFLRFESHKEQLNLRTKSLTPSL